MISEKIETKQIQRIFFYISLFQDEVELSRRRTALHNRISQMKKEGKEMNMETYEELCVEFVVPF